MFLNKYNVYHVSFSERVQEGVKEEYFNYKVALVEALNKREISAVADVKKGESIYVNDRESSSVVTVSDISNMLTYLRKEDFKISRKGNVFYVMDTKEEIKINDDIEDSLIKISFIIESSSSKRNDCYYSYNKYRKKLEDMLYCEDEYTSEAS